MDLYIVYKQELSSKREECITGQRFLFTENIGYNFLIILEF